MASFTSLNPHSSLSGDPKLSSAFSRRSALYFETSAVRLPTGKKRAPLRTMAVAKFKGTQMREKHLTEMIEKKILEAKEVCEGNQGSDECKVAWDEGKEVSCAKADLRKKMEKKDPLESLCEENRETDECRIYED
ncbi:calvin cycle protein CP12-3, chloroplastic-like [Magnolia sinica]|uniref:calvin cycle protein CP12-3, chloroplastic-like n=1 Tax=Magnolia sinica TaxID=86752 RepID=UPI0026580984|nr:calvin cycle protein CP12-3, chloroplastic-like [Magnolia sinica]